MTDVEKLQRFYLDPAGDDENLFDIWERGDARGDSVTPSTYSAEYRTWMTELLRSHLDERHGGMISIGSGNAVIESDLVRAGYRVLAVDVFPQAVKHAQRKGVEAVCADVMQWEPPSEQTWSVVYADGLMGHLYEPGAGLLPILSHVRGWLAPQGGVLVISNDRPPELPDVEPAPGVPGFYWLSEEFLRKQAAAAGFHDVLCTTFVYQRPLSGNRTRAILTVGVTAA